MSLYGQKITMLIPCMDREEDLKITLPQWLEQTYENRQVFIVDYGSKRPIADVVFTIAKSYGCSFLYNDYSIDTDVVLFRMEDVSFFNICHAYNFAAVRVESGIISLVCADCCPYDYYLDACMNIISDQTFLRIHGGMYTITKENYTRLNGLQEFIVGWGGEDDDFRQRAIMAGLRGVVLPQHLVFKMERPQQAIQINRETPSLFDSNQVNRSRMLGYQMYRGYIGNYGQSIGQDQPIKFIPLGLFEQENLDHHPHS